MTSIDHLGIGKAVNWKEEFIHFLHVDFGDMICATDECMVT